MSEICYRVLVWQTGKGICCRYEWIADRAEKVVYSVFDEDMGRWDVMGMQSVEALSEQLKSLQRGSDQRKAYIYKGYRRVGRDFELASYAERIEGFLYKSWIVPYALRSERVLQK